MISEVADNVLGTIGTVFWCIQLIPQIIRNYKVKDCEGFPPAMASLWAASGVPFSIYFIVTNGAIPMRVQPQIFTFFCTISFCQALYYPPVQMASKKIALYVVPFVLISIGLEVGLILWLRPLYNRGIKWPSLIVGIFASILLAVGLLPPYFELFKRKGRVVGINFIFLAMDSMGALFSTLSIIVGDMDVLGMVLYLIVLALELGIFTSHIIWMIRFRGVDTDKLDSDEEKSVHSDLGESHDLPEDIDKGAERPSSNLEIQSGDGKSQSSTGITAQLNEEQPAN